MHAPCGASKGVRKLVGAPSKQGQGCHSHSWLFGEETALTDLRCCIAGHQFPMSDSRPRVLCLHGWRTNAKFMEFQLKLSGSEFYQMFDLVFLDGAHTSPEGVPDCERMGISGVSAILSTHTLTPSTLIYTMPFMHLSSPSHFPCLQRVCDGVAGELNPRLLCATKHCQNCGGFKA